VIAFLYRWVFVDFWVPVWPNLAAAVICAFHITRSNKKHMRIYFGDGGDDAEEDSTGDH
jgi:hypothetical protein